MAVDEMDLKELFNYFLANIHVIIILMSAVVVAGLIYCVYIQKPMYSSYTTIVLAGRTDVNTSITQNDLTLNSNLVSTYQEIIKSRKILNKVIDNLNIEMTYSELAKNVSINSESNTELIRITVNNKNNKEAAFIANEIAKVFSKEIINIYNIQNVSIIDKAEVPSLAYNINYPKQLVLYFLIGCVVGLGVVFIMFYFDNTIKSREDVEKIGFVLLGTVPHSAGRSA